VTTLGDLVLETQRRALSSMREELNQLGTSVSAGATTLSLAAGQTLGSIQAGAVIQVDYELFLVQGTPSASSIAVVPGYLDSTTAAHTAGSIITVNPRFPAVDVIKAINETIDDLSSPMNGLYQVKEVTLTYSPVVVGYDFTDSGTGTPVTSWNMLEVLEVRVHDYGPAQAWDVIPPTLYKVQRNADTSVFPSGMALELYGGGYPGRPIRVQYKAPYTTPLAATTDDVATVAGLHPQAHDIPTLGAAYRLMAWREFKRSFTEAQGEPRRAQEVPVGASLTAVKLVAQQLQNRIDAERVRLDSMYRRQWR
jgi:hypothetical protein